MTPADDSRQEIEVSVFQPLMFKRSGVLEEGAKAVIRYSSVHPHSDRPLEVTGRVETVTDSLYGQLILTETEPRDDRDEPRTFYVTHHSNTEADKHLILTSDTGSSTRKIGHVLQIDVYAAPGESDDEAWARRIDASFRGTREYHDELTDT